MKKSLFLLFAIGASLSVRSEESRPQIKQLESLVELYASTSGGRFKPPGSSVFLDYAATNQITKSDVYGVVERYADRACQEMESTTVENVWRGNARRFSRILDFMEETGEKGWVPFLEKKYQSVDRFTRANILLAYIGLVRADSVGFVEKAITEEDVETRAYRSIYRKIAGQMKTANNEGREKILGFFLRRIETVSDDSERNLLDQILEAGLPEYRASTQRKRYADRFMKSEHEFARQRGKDILQEIEKVPTSQRKDLSELLRKPADERKSE